VRPANCSNVRYKRSSPSPESMRSTDTRPPCFHMSSSAASSSASLGAKLIWPPSVAIGTTTSPERARQDTPNPVPAPRIVMVPPASPVSCGPMMRKSLSSRRPTASASAGLLRDDPPSVGEPGGARLDRTCHSNRRTRRKGGHPCAFEVAPQCVAERCKPLRKIQAVQDPPWPTQCRLHHRESGVSAAHVADQNLTIGAHGCRTLLTPEPTEPGFFAPPRRNAGLASPPGRCFDAIDPG
jgi:hypothetical protein